MTKYIFPLIFSIALMGCDQFQNNRQQLKWAIVDKNKVVNSTFETFKKNNPYPTELGNEDDSKLDMSQIQSQISQLETNAKQKCFDANSERQKKTSLKMDKTDRVISTSKNAINFVIPVSSLESLPKKGVTNSMAFDNEYHDCIANIAKDQVNIDLHARLNKLIEATGARYRHDIDNRKKAEEYVNTAIAKYAEVNHYKMLVNSNSGGDYILYSEDKVSLNVTDDVLDFISKNQMSESKSNKPISK
jgi:hypothetical protein